MLVTRQCESEQHPWSSRFEALFSKATSPRMSSFNGSSTSSNATVQQHLASAQEEAPDAQNRPSLSGLASDTGHSRPLDPLGLRQPKAESPTQKSAETRDSTYSIKAEPAQDDSLASTDVPGLARGPNPRESDIAVERGQVISTDQGGNENAVVEKEEDDDVLEDDEMVEAEGEQPSQPQTAAERTAARRKMKRFRLPHQQTRFLMSEFAKQPHPDAAHRERLSREIPGLSPRQVQVWFQNSLDAGSQMPSQTRQSIRPLQPLHLRDTMSRSRPENLQSPLRSSMSWKGGSIDYSSYASSSDAPSIPGRYQSVYQPDQMGNNVGGGLSYESGSYSSAGLQSSPTNINYSSVQPPTLQQPQHNRSRLRAASANIPLGLDLRHQYRPGHGLQPSNHSSAPRAASTSPYGNAPTYTTGYPSAPLTAPVDFSLPRTPSIRTRMGIQPEGGRFPVTKTALWIRGDQSSAAFEYGSQNYETDSGLSVNQRMESFQKTVQKLESADMSIAASLADLSPSCTSFDRMFETNAVE
ncbi:hypothetical protein DL765_002684 [Monosporascus sp. GIB2]|nr:hypothetical protein DL765_002684 [Monosporascus sp. GIB2]